LLIELCEAKAEFLLVGGWAVILYGHVRATDDMDVFVRPSRTNSERVFAALEAFGAPLRAHAVAPSLRERRESLDAFAKYLRAELSSRSRSSNGALGIGEPGSGVRAFITQGCTIRGETVRASGSGGVLRRKRWHTRGRHHNPRASGAGDKRARPPDKPTDRRRPRAC